jgi:hypothetical protein
MKPASGNSPKETARTLWRKQVKERLERNLEALEFYCQPGVRLEDDVTGDGWAAKEFSAVFRIRKLCCWPASELLTEIKDDVLFLYFLERNKPIWPIWDAFEHVDRRMKKLQLTSRVNDLIRRALARRSTMLSIESELSKAAKKGKSKETSRLLCDIDLGKRKLFELLLEDRLVVKQQRMALPLVDWVIAIRHPLAKVVHNIVEFFPTVEELKTMRRREKTRERVQRYRSGQKNSSK